MTMRMLIIMLLVIQCRVAISQGVETFTPEVRRTMHFLLEQTICKYPLLSNDFDKILRDWTLDANNHVPQSVIDNKDSLYVYIYRNGECADIYFNSHHICNACGTYYLRDWTFFDNYNCCLSDLFRLYDEDGTYLQSDEVNVLELINELQNIYNSIYVEYEENLCLPTVGMKPLLEYSYYSFDKNGGYRLLNSAYDGSYIQQIPSNICALIQSFCKRYNLSQIICPILQRSSFEEFRTKIFEQNRVSEKNLISQIIGTEMETKGGISNWMGHKFLGFKLDSISKDTVCQYWPEKFMRGINLQYASQAEKLLYKYKDKILLESNEPNYIDIVVDGIILWKYNYDECQKD